MRSKPQVEKFREGAERRLKRLRAEEKTRFKGKGALDRVNLYTHQIARVDAQQSVEAIDKELADLDVAELERDYEAAYAEEGINVDGSPPPGPSKTAKIAAKLAAARQKVAENHHANRIRALEKAKRSLAAERARYVGENLELVEAELLARARKVGNQHEHAESFVQRLVEDWRQIQAVWQEIERYWGHGARYSVPDCPLRPSDQPDAAPIPRELDEEADPTITSEAVAA